MKSNVFQNALAKTSAVFGRKEDVKVVFAGDQAKTNGSTITLPSLNKAAEISDDDAAVLRGYVDHEAGHVRHTDFDVLRNNQSKLKGNKLLHSCANALEDIWLEKRVMGEYHGARTNLRATSERVNKMFLDSMDEVSPQEATTKISDPTWVGPVAITWQGRKDYGGERNQECLDLIADDKLLSKLEEWVGRLDGCDSSHDVFALAEEAEQWLRDNKPKRPSTTRPERGEGEGGDTGQEASKGQEPQEPKGGEEGQPPTEGQGGPSSTEKESEGNEQQDGQAEGEVADGQRDDSNDGSDGASVGERHADPEGDGNSETNRRDEEAASNDDAVDHEAEVEAKPYEKFGLGEAIEDLVNGINQSGRGQITYTVYNGDWDKWHTRHDVEFRDGYTKDLNNNLGRLLRRGNTSDYDTELGAMGGTANAVRRKLERALMSKQKRDWDTGREDGRLDVRRLPAAMSGRTNVFKTRTDRTDLDTAVTLLCDLSGSMAGGRIEMARQTVMCLAEAIDRTGIAYEILGFENCSDWPHDAHFGQGWNDASRFNPLDMVVFKSFDERLPQAKGCIAAMERRICRGYNSDGDAVSNAHERLLQRQESRKVLLVLSDGQPAADDNRAEANWLADVVRDIHHKSDTDVVGIGILSNEVEKYYPNHVVIYDLDDLTGGVMDQLAKLLLGDRFVVDNSKLLDRAV